METIYLPRDIAQETHIALVDRACMLGRESREAESELVREIATRQLARVIEALAVFNTVLQEG